jgi:hypothetical protein
VKKIANVPPHLFSIKGDTFAEGPLGQNILDPSLFIGAISRSCARSSLAEDILMSMLLGRNASVQKKDKSQSRNEQSPII